MANQESSFQETGIAGGQTARNRRLAWIIVAAAVVMLLAIAAYWPVSDDGRAQGIEVEPPVGVPARLDGDAVGEPQAAEWDNAGLYPRISATPWEYNHGQ